MAKRVKLLPTDPKQPKMATIPGMSEVVRTLEIQGLMTLPEAEKLRQLDKQMKAIAEDAGSTLTLDEKVRKFESKLAEFRELQNELVKKGGVSLIEEQQAALREEDKHIYKEVIANVVKDFLVTTLAAAQPAAAHVPPGTHHVPPGAQPVPPGTLPQLPLRPPPQLPPRPQPVPLGTQPPGNVTQPTPAKRVRPEANNSSMSMSAFSTPPSSFSTPKAEDAHLESPSATAADEDKELSLNIHVLKSLGMRVEGEKVYFPSPRDKSIKRKKDYSRKTFDRAVRYIVQNEAEMPYNTSGALSQIHEMLSNTGNYDALLKMYPNLKIVGERTKDVTLVKQKRGSNLDWETL
jgi:hypothetical protein